MRIIGTSRGHLASPASGAIKASAPKPVICSRPSTTGSPKGRYPGSEGGEGAVRRARRISGAAAWVVRLIPIRRRAIRVSINRRDFLIILGSWVAQRRLAYAQKTAAIAGMVIDMKASFGTSLVADTFVRYMKELSTPITEMTEQYQDRRGIPAFFEELRSLPYIEGKIFLPGHVAIDKAS